MQLYNEGDAAEIQDEINTISTVDQGKLDWEKPPKGSLYGWYYATQCMFQVGGKKWISWNRKFQILLNNNQHKEGYWIYPQGGHDKACGDDISKKVYATTLCALMLTVYYRYLPSGKSAGGFAEKVKAHSKKHRAKVEEDDEEVLDLLD